MAEVLPRPQPAGHSGRGALEPIVVVPIPSNGRNLFCSAPLRIRTLTDHEQVRSAAGTMT